MSISARQQKILEILSERLFVSVGELSELTFTSPSSVRRDLASMQRSGLVKRTHGGAALPEHTGGVASFHDRAHRSIREKRIIAKKASELLSDGQSILLDSSSTASFLLPYIARLNSATLFTNNLETALRAIELGIDTHCLGGRSVGGSASLSGTETYNAIMQINVDIFFFSSQSLDENGNISDATDEENFIRGVMLGRSAKSVFLCDSSKFGTTSLYRLCSLDDVDAAVFDEPYEGLVTSTGIM